MQTRSPEDISGAELKPMAHMLTSFGKSNRNKGEKENTGSMVQSSVLMNSRFVKDRLTVTEASRMGKLLYHNPPLSNSEIIEEMFLAFVSRLPTSDEKTVAIEALQKHHTQGLQDLAWSLLNKPEFVFNY